MKAEFCVELWCRFWYVSSGWDGLGNQVLAFSVTECIYGTFLFLVYTYVWIIILCIEIYTPGYQYF